MRIASKVHKYQHERDKLEANVHSQKRFYISRLAGCVAIFLDAVCHDDAQSKLSHFTEPQSGFCSSRFSSSGLEADKAGKVKPFPQVCPLPLYEKA